MNLDLRLTLCLGTAGLITFRMNAKDQIRATAIDSGHTKCPDDMPGATGRRFDVRSQITVALWCLILWGVRVAYGLDPSRHISQYGHTAWRLGQNGLNSVPLSIAQTPDGYIWVGTSYGLFRFDGVRFTRWSPSSGEQLRSSYIFRLLGANDGSLYIGTDTGLSRLTHGHIYNYPETLQWPGPFFEDSQGSVWMGDFGNFTSASTLCRVGKEHLTCFGTKDGFDCMNGTSLMSEHAGSIWVGSKEGICHWQQDKQPVNFPLPYLSGPNMANNWVDALTSDGKGTLWSGIPIEGPGYGLLAFTGDRWQSYVTPELDGTSLPVTSLLCDRSSSLWIGTRSKGLYKMNAGKLDRFDTADGLSGNTINGIFQDREGNLWVVTDRGLDAFRDLPVVSYTTREGLSDDQAIAIAASDDGTVWVGTKGSLVLFRGQTFSTITPANGLPTSGVHYLFHDSRNQLWVAGGQQLYLYKDSHFVPVLDQNSADIGYVVYMTEDSKHKLWVSAQDRKTGKDSLLHIDATHVVERYRSLGAMGAQGLNAIASDQNGGLWAGGYKHGLFRFHDGNFERVAAGGFDGPVVEMAGDPDGAIWIVTKQEGMLRYKDNKARSLTSRSGLPCDSGFDIVNDHVGHHWLYMACGIVKIDDSELAHWWSDPAYYVQTTVFGLLEGAQPRRSETSPVATPDGRIWSVDRSAVQVIDPKHLPHNDTPPPVHIERIGVDHKEYPVGRDIRFPVSPHEVEIDYSALSFVVPEEVRFRYQLVGYDNAWTDSGTRRQAFYNDLGPGHNTFRVMACNNDGVWNQQGTTISFMIPPAWYQTAWFKFLCVIFAATLAYTLYQFRIRQYAAMLKARFDERIEERTRLARDLHDTLLQTIQGSKMVADNALERPSDAAHMHKALDLVSTWLERATLEGRAALNSLRSSTVDTNDLAAAFRHAAEDCRIGSTIQVSHILTGTSSDMHPIVRDEIYRIGYEAINNACVHSGGSLVTVELTYNHNVQLKIRDNGKGIEEKTLQSGKTGHFGLEGMRERADRIGAKLLVRTAPNDGTEVTLLVPGSVVFKTYRPTKRSQLLKLFAIGQDSTQHNGSGGGAHN
ncbi:two-component regulator propeller domain-containing protein [Tunturibacter empetritectus]|uniref:Two-component regulator propeller domain-containing protein n=1 Tax=Tunturiibacter empetritectus TaxID=3069691 RepID=A0AAU7ZD80_9BACT